MGGILLWIESKTNRYKQKRPRIPRRKEPLQINALSETYETPREKR
ncbi:hypothetical protein [Aquimarina hainanensis]